MQNTKKKTGETSLLHLAGKQVFAVFSTNVFEREPTEHFAFFETLEELNGFLAEFEYIEELEELEIFHGVLLSAKVLPADISYQLDAIIVAEDRSDASKMYAMLLDGYEPDEVASLVEDIVKKNSMRNLSSKDTPTCTIDNVFLFYAYSLQPTFAYWTYARGDGDSEKEPIIDEETLQKDCMRAAQKVVEEVDKIMRRLEGWEKGLSNSK